MAERQEKTVLGNWVKSLRQMSHLEKQVVRRGICSRCHKKSLREVVGGFYQCNDCGQVFIL